MSGKPRIIKDFEKLDPEMQEQFLAQYANGFNDFIIRFTDKDGKYSHAVPFETEDRYYLIRMQSLSKTVVEKPEPETDESSETDPDPDPDSDFDEKFDDLDTMKVGGNKPKSDDEEFE